MNLDKGVATLATLWGVQPTDVAERLAITLDFSHLTPAQIGYRATRALRSQNHKYHTKKHRAKKVKSPNPQTMQLLANPKFFNSLHSKLLKYAKSKIKYTPDAEDLVSETILTASTYPASSPEHLTAIALNTLKKALSSYFHKLYNSPISITPHEDFYILEETFNLYENTSPETQPIKPTSNLLEAFKRVAAELVHQLGLQHAASTIGIRSYTLANALNP
jgi:DNA-directed RNA polymerase specialized sigma24 family protein